MEFLEECRAVRQPRDEFLIDAQSLTGRPRAIKLDEALDAVGKVLTDDVTLDEPPLMTFYSTEINEILRLEPSADSPLRQKYARLQQELVVAQARNALSQKFDEIAESGGNNAAIKYADELLQEATDPSLRRRLKRYRRVYLEWADRFQEALEETRDQMRDPELTAKERHWLEDREKFNLGHLGRDEEALAIIDRWILDAGDDRNQRRIAFQEKGQFLINRAADKAALAFEQAAELSDEGSEEWWENKGMAAWRWLDDKDHQRAVSAHEALLRRSDLAADFKPYLLLRLIESRLALGEREQAEERWTQLRKAVADCPKDLLAAEDAKWLLNRCEQLFSEASKSDTRSSSDR